MPHASLATLDLERRIDRLIEPWNRPGSPGVTANFHRVTKDAALPGDIAGSYVNDEAAARWTALASGVLTVDGPLAKASAWTIEPIEGDFVRISANATWRRATFDGRILRDAAGTVTGLMVSGGRVKNMLMRRVVQ